jgi:hypothetical protein
MHAVFPQDFLESLPLNVRVQTLMQVQKEKKGKKLEKTIKVKIKIYNLYSTLPPRQRR